MKRKTIPSALHNFGHSFLSFNNYVDDVFILDLLPEVVRRSGGRLDIHFPSGRVEPPGDVPEALAKSIGYWSNDLSKHLDNHGIPMTVLGDVVLRITLTASGMRREVHATDELGRDYVATVA
ncbi:MAG: hypothetical protein K8T90_20280 [Planctomycetes bacterium]|nr:hypothetical protein [Planctomycetota bacterium]